MRKYKTRLLNMCRQIFKIGILERGLATKTRGKRYDSFYCKLIPPEYCYNKNTFRRVLRDEIFYELDISNVMGHSAYWGYTDDSHSYLFSLPKAGDVIFDVGSNIGTTTLPLARLTNNGEIYSFEPSRENYKKLMFNLGLNTRFTKVKPYNIGFGAKPSAHRLYDVSDNNPGMKRIMTNGNASNLQYEEVVIDTIDNFVNANKIYKLNLIKIDVEGFECEVLKGAETTIKFFLPNLFIELDDENLRVNNSSAKEIIDLIARYGYAAYNVSGKIILATEDFTNCHYDIFCKPLRRSNLEND